MQYNALLNCKNKQFKKINYKVHQKALSYCFSLKSSIFTQNRAIKCTLINSFYK